jgi:hypothetical protein
MKVARLLGAAIPMRRVDVQIQTACFPEPPDLGYLRVTVAPWICGAMFV